MKREKPSYTTEDIFELTHEIAQVDTSEELKNKLLSTLEYDRTRDALAAHALQGPDELLASDRAKPEQLQGYALWQVGFEAIQDKEDMRAWHSLAASSTFQDLLKSSTTTNVKGRYSPEPETVLEKIFEVGVDDQAFLEDSAAVWGNLYHQFHQKLGSRSAKSRRRQPHIIEDEVTPAERLSHGMARRLAKDYPGDSVRAVALTQAGALQYREGNERRFFYHRYREKVKGSKFTFENPRSLLAIARSLDDFMSTPEYIRGMSELLVSSLDSLDMDAQPDSRKAMDFLGGASFVMMTAVDFAADKPGPTRKDLQQINTFLQEGRRARTGRLEQPSLASITKLSNGLLQSINNYLAEQEDLTPITQPTIEGYYDAFERILFVVNELAQTWENAEDRQMLFDMSNIATALIKHGAPRIRNRDALK